VRAKVSAEGTLVTVAFVGTFAGDFVHDVLGTPDEEDVKGIHEAFGAYASFFLFGGAIYGIIVHCCSTNDQKTL